MKLKEIPPYLKNKWRLSLMSASKLNKRNLEQEIPVIVSLTTIPSRIKIVHLTVRSILSQELKPKKVVLWLHNSFEGNLPMSLQKLQGELFEVRYSQHDYSHLKLFESITAFPDDIIITVDDDLMYPPNFLKLLYESHKQYPNDIISNQVRVIHYNTDGQPLPYIEWHHTTQQPEDPTNVMPLGVFGVLYPPNSMDERVTDANLFIELSPKADDLWFKAMSLLKGTTSRLPIHKSKNPILIIGTQKIALKRTNKLQDFNRVQWLRLMDYFKLMDL